MIKYQPGLEFYGYRPLTHCLVPLLGLKKLREVVALLSKLVGLSFVMGTKMCLPNQHIPTHCKFTYCIDLIDKSL